MIGRKRPTIMLLVAALTVSIMGPGTSRAQLFGTKGSITATSILTVDCTLPVWVPPGVRKGTCGVFLDPPGTLVGADWGVNKGAGDKKDLYVNACAPTCSVTAVFNYIEILAGAVGFASGLATVNGAAAIKPIQISPTPGVGAKPNTSSTLRVPFAWLRIGGWAIVTTGKAQPLNPAFALIPPNKDGGPNKIKSFGDGKTAQDQFGGISLAAFIPKGVPVIGAPLGVTVVALNMNLV